MLVGLDALEPEGTQLAWEELRARHLDALGRVTEHHTELRVAMRSLGAIMFGADAVRFFEDTVESTWPLRRCDFAVPQATFEAFCTFLIARLGGTSLEYWESTRAMDPLKHEHLGISRRRVISLTGITVIVHGTVSVCPLAAVAASQASHLFTFISADAACAAYPLCNMRRTMIPRQGIDKEIFEVVQAKYEDRGYDLQDDREQEGACSAHGMCARDVRHFGDVHCLTIIFNHPCAVDEVLDAMPWRGKLMRMRVEVGRRNLTSTWSLGGEPCGNEECSLPVEFNLENSGLYDMVALY